MSQKMKVTRVSVSLPPPLVEKLDKTWRSMRYENRSKAVHDAVRSFITEFEWMQKDTGRITGAVLVLYYLDKPGSPRRDHKSPTQIQECDFFDSARSLGR
jgi:metal-responsive CopG/Arc/MetJ family transcriptional regulator